MMWAKILFSILIFLVSSCQKASENSLASHPKRQVVSSDLPDRAVYLGAGGALGLASFLARVGWGICQLSPWADTTGKEFLLLSDACGSAAGRSVAYAFRGMSPMPSLLRAVLPSYSSWHLNQMSLSAVPALTQEEKKLLLFLKNRWLAKSTGYYSFLINWACPCFGMCVQVHPETTNSYARDPSNKISQTYENRVNSWKRSLPHPWDYPLILTRPFDCQDYLPSHIEVLKDQNLEEIFLKIQNPEENLIVDVTSIFPKGMKDPKQWLNVWEPYRAVLSKQNQLICIQRLEEEGVGGIRILPLAAQGVKEVEKHYQFLLHWISKFGLSANRIELDRPSSCSNDFARVSPSAASCDREEFLSYLNALDLDSSISSEKALMVQGALQVLKGLLSHLTEDKWNEIEQSPTHSCLVQLSFSKIKEQFDLLAKGIKEFSFYDTASHIEQIQANLTSLLEIFTPFSPSDFPSIYRALLKSVPQKLLPLTSCGVHATGMTSLTGILKAVERTFGKTPRALYGENTYFEVIRALELASNSTSIQEAAEEDWKEADLLVVQFNPVLKRIDFEVTEYRVENIEEAVCKSLKARQGKPLILALDCTLDYLDSPRAAQLLTAFQKEIQTGALNVICYRSGIKFDLFGLDNYCGAPIYMIHNQDAKWASFDLLLRDPVLQTDRLSLNWFCLAYENAVPHLEQYRKQVFTNTRALLNKMPDRLFQNEGVNYRVIPMQPDVEPAFIDIKIFGFLHELRGSLVGGVLTVKCLEEKHPMFYRPSLGFSHPNLSILYGKDCTTIRLTLGLDPSQVDVLADCFATIDALNGPAR